MFNNIQGINTKWVKDNLEILSSIQQLVEPIDYQSGINLRSCIKLLYSIDEDTRNAICKDHIFSKLISDLKVEILRVYEDKNHEWDCDVLDRFINITYLSVFMLSGNETSYEILPVNFNTELIPGTGKVINFSAFNLNNNKTHYTVSELTSCIEKLAPQLIHSFPRVQEICIVDDKFDFFLDHAGEEYTVDFERNINGGKWERALGQSIELIKCNEQLYRLISNHVKILVPLKQKQIVQNLSFSARNLPSVIFKSYEQAPYLFGETLVHEADHQYFYAIEKFHDFWKSDVKLQDPVFYSPWRDDPRPLDGILRGLSAFVRVSQYYSSVINNLELSEDKINGIGETLVLRLLQSRIALSGLWESDELSSFGISYVNEISEIIESLISMFGSRSEFNIWQAEAHKSIDAHRAQWAILNKNIQL